MSVTICRLKTSTVTLPGKSQSVSLPRSALLCDGLAPGLPLYPAIYTKYCTNGCPSRLMEDYLDSYIICVCLNLLVVIIVYGETFALLSN